MSANFGSLYTPGVARGKAGLANLMLSVLQMAGSVRERSLETLSKNHCLWKEGHELSCKGRDMLERIHRQMSASSGQQHQLSQDIQKAEAMLGKAASLQAAATGDLLHSHIILTSSMLLKSPCASSMQCLFLCAAAECHSCSAHHIGLYWMMACV